MSEKLPRKPRGAAIEQTAFMDALDTDPTAAMMALADEAESDWQSNAGEFENLTQAKPETD